MSNTEALLALVELEPEFVSQNENNGRIECDVIFPLGYTNFSEEEMEADLKLAGVLPDDADEETKDVEGSELDGDDKTTEGVESTTVNEDGEKSEIKDTKPEAGETQSTDTRSIDNKTK